MHAVIVKQLICRTYPDLTTDKNQKGPLPAKVSKYFAAYFDIPIDEGNDKGKRLRLLNVPSGITHIGKITKSRSNWENVTAVMSLLADIREKDVIPMEDILIITPYKDQYKLYKAELNKLRLVGVKEHPRVATIDGSQSQEGFLVVFDSVITLGDTAGDLGFNTDERRANVAFTRARDMLFIVVNTTLLSGTYVSNIINNKGKKGQDRHPMADDTTNESTRVPYLIEYISFLARNGCLHDIEIETVTEAPAILKRVTETDVEDVQEPQNDATQEDGNQATGPDLGDGATGANTWGENIVGGVTEADTWGGNIVGKNNEEENTKEKNAGEENTKKEEENTEEKNAGEEKTEKEEENTEEEDAGEENTEEDHPW